MVANVRQQQGIDHNGDPLAGQQHTCENGRTITLAPRWPPLGYNIIIDLKDNIRSQWPPQKNVAGKSVNNMASPTMHSPHRQAYAPSAPIQLDVMNQGQSYCLIVCASEEGRQFYTYKIIIKLKPCIRQRRNHIMEPRVDSTSIVLPSATAVDTTYDALRMGFIIV